MVHQFRNKIVSKLLHVRLCLFRDKSYRNICNSSPRQNIQENKYTWSYQHGLSNQPLQGATVGKLVQKRAEEHPEREAYVFCKDNKRLTFEDLLRKTDQLAAGLLDIGVQKGDRVGMWGPSTEEWALVQYATARIGAILVNINPAYRPSELEYCIRHVGIKCIVAAEQFKTSNYYESLFHLNPQLAFCKPGELNNPKLPSVKIVIMLGETHHPGTFRFQDVLDGAGNDRIKQVKEMQDEMHFDEPINIQFTSGTTGKPKGAILSHHNIVNNSYFTGLGLNYHKELTRILNPVPFYHCFGMVLGSLTCVTLGTTNVIASPSFEPEPCLQAIHNERCTSVYGVPTMFIDILNHHNFDKYDMTSIRTGIMAGSPCPISVMQQVFTKMNARDMCIAYGQTETSPVTALTHMDSPIEKRCSSVGHAFSHVEIKISDENGRTLPVNQKGEVCNRGYTTMLGYWNDEAKTKESLTDDRWFKTGDLGMMDEDGYISIVGRIKDVIIRGGENIYPAELEQFLYTYPKIEDIQVVGVFDERMGEEVCACIRVHENQTLTVEEVKDFCKGKDDGIDLNAMIDSLDSSLMKIISEKEKSAKDKMMVYEEEETGEERRKEKHLEDKDTDLEWVKKIDKMSGVPGRLKDYMRNKQLQSKRGEIWHIDFVEGSEDDVDETSFNINLGH